MPVAALTTKSAASATRQAARLSPRNTENPGVSRRLIFPCGVSMLARLVLRVSLRAISSGSKSRTLVPSSTEPSLLVAPLVKSNASAREVFPARLPPSMTTFRS